MRRNVTVECSAELCGVTHKMAFEWRHRVLATVSGHRDRIALRDTVWVDEANVNDTDLSKGYGQARKRGLSRQKLCTRVAIDIHKNPVAVVCGHGKPSSARVEKTMGGRIASESLLVHDLKRMEMANDLCSWLKRYFWCFTGMLPRNLQAYLDWYVYLFRVNQARDR